MSKMDWRQKLKKTWLSLTIKKKNWFFTGVVFFIVFLSILFDIWVVDFSANDFQVILEDNARNSEFMDALEAESKCFEAYIKNPAMEKQKVLREACSKTKQALFRLPYEYNRIGDYRYNKTWSIRSSYEIYEEKRDLVLKMTEEDVDYIKQLYKVYDMQNFMQEYTRALITYTLKQGTNDYIRKQPYLKGLPMMIIFFSIVFVGGIISLTKLMNSTLILPLVDLANASKKIAVNDFNVEDIEVYSQDEIGELVNAFNIMKHNTGHYIKALEEKRQMTERLHQEELEKLEVERRLDVAQFELLKNQIKPHFLFNTLNVIGGMAKLEDAKITEQMIKALSSLFRYNLKTPEVEVTAEKELKVVKDYMYIQQMRFGSRINYQIECKLEPSQIKVPAFSFQPLVENAIIHGIAKKEEGGRIYIRIWRKGKDAIISVADTGAGMSAERLKEQRDAFKQGATAQMGIGLGNIYSRVHMMYPDGEMEIYSKENVGTVVKLKIPQTD